MSAPDVAACTHKLSNDPSGLCCVRADEHDPGAAGGHVYEHGSAVDDRHGEGGHG